MARKPSRKDQLKGWQRRVEEADKAYDSWEKEYQCEDLEAYYLGRQWPDEYRGADDSPYTINRVFPSLEARKPSLLFNQPRFRVRPKKAKVDDPFNLAKERADLREDTLNTVIADPDSYFQEVTNLCVHEAHFRFGVVEVGYSADFTENPNLGKPMLDDDGKPLVDREGNEVINDVERIPQDEKIFFKRIPAQQFRVSLNSKNLLHHHDWIGYYEWHHMEDVRRNTRYNRTARLAVTGKIRDDVSQTSYSDDDDEDKRHKDMVKVWKVWDIRRKKRHVFADNPKGGEGESARTDDFLSFEESFKFLPFAGLRFHEILDEWYPLPPVVNWLDPQDELNESREMQRVHRRRAVRRYGHLPGAEKSMEKLEDSGDFSYAEFASPDSVWAIQDAPLDPQVFANINLAKEDFDEVSGVTAEQRGVAQAETATQANILDVRSQIREGGSRVLVSRWLAHIGRLVLLTIEENMSLPFWIKTNVDLKAAGAPQEVAKTALLWKQISVEDFDDLDYEVNVEIASLSPVARESERQSWNAILTLISLPQMQMIFSQSELLLRKTLMLYGIENENEIQEIMKLLQSVAQQQQLAALAQGDAGGLTGGSATDTPTQDQIGNQLVQQLSQGR